MQLHNRFKKVCVEKYYIESVLTESTRELYENRLPRNYELKITRILNVESRSTKKCAQEAAMNE